MGMRENASFCRPRLFDSGDPEMPDDVKLILEALDETLEEAMEDGDKATVRHVSDLQDRVVSSAGEEYAPYAEKPEDGA